MDKFLSNYMDFKFYFWDNLFSIIGILGGAFVAILVYRLEKKVTARAIYEHEIKITNAINRMGIYRSVILADVKKYRSFRKDKVNKTYYKQGAELYTIVPECGVQFILNPKDENITVGLVPFEWIDYIREDDSEDNKPIIVCKFKGVKYYKKFKSPFKEVGYVYKNPNYEEGVDPKFRMFTENRPKKLN